MNISHLLLNNNFQLTLPSAFAPPGLFQYPHLEILYSVSSSWAVMTSPLCEEKTVEELSGIVVSCELK